MARIKTNHYILTGINHFDRFVMHPSILLKFLIAGQIGAAKGAIEISLKDLSTEKFSMESNLEDSQMQTFLGKMGFVSQEFLYRLVRVFKPKLVIETGVHVGVSSAFILQGLHDNGNGMLYSIDLPLSKFKNPNGKPLNYQFPRKGDTGFGVPERLKERWTLLLGDSHYELPKLLDKLGSCDLFFHDSEHSYENMMFEFSTVFPHLSDNAVVSSDDVSLNNAFRSFCALKNLIPHIVGEQFGFAILKE